MKKIKAFLLIIVLLSCSKTNNSTTPNHSPIASLTSTLTSVSPFTYNFIVTASDVDGDKLTYTWDFGDGTTKTGSAQESYQFESNKTYTIKVKVSDGKTTPAQISVTINTSVINVTLDGSVKYQTMDGFGGFGAQDVYWSSGPFTSSRFVNDVINDLGLTILRDDLPDDFENVNDDNDPYTTTLSNFHYGELTNHIQYLKDMKAAGLKKLIVSSWTPPAWMKTNNNINGEKADAPDYNPNPTAKDNQLKTDMYEEFAERCVAYIKIVKQETGIDVYAFSLQNEPRFSEPYGSCVFNGEALRDLIKVVGKRFADDDIKTKIFMPEDIGYLDGVSGMVQPTLNDADTRKYVSIIAVHGYALDGVTANSPDAETWQTMYSWGKPYNMPLWMTETSGYSNDMKGAMDLAKAMFIAINYGNVSAWLHWIISQQTIDEFALMSSSGEKSKRYYVSKNFYHYIRPGDYRIKVSANDQTNIYPLAFKNDTANTTSIILINNNETDQAVKISGTVLPLQFEIFVTSADDDCKANGTIDVSKGFILPANSVVTLYKKN
ncbi:MAG: PKD domain-containing protein [Bacteroidetes bacterium]|nr:PKD domain-containing protein [Bacteroidota bacterium]